ncbi:MAG: hypothetical protein AVDCRST_MAG17-292, partial [uncultured Solirubrobacterales bacterium]
CRPRTSSGPNSSQCGGWPTRGAATHSRRCGERSPRPHSTTEPPLTPSSAPRRTSRCSCSSPSVSSPSSTGSATGCPTRSRTPVLARPGCSRCRSPRSGSGSWGSTRARWRRSRT